MSNTKGYGSFNVKIDTASLDKLKTELKSLEKEVPSATASALNRTIQFVYTHIGRIVVDNYNIKSKEVKATMANNITKASRKNLQASVKSRGHMLSFAHFPFTPKKSGSNRYVKVKIKKKDGYKEVKTQNRPFVATTGAKSDDKIQFNVFKRVGKERKPIVVLRTLSIPQMISNETTEEKITTLANKKLAERIDHEISFRLKRAQEKMKG